MVRNLQNNLMEHDLYFNMLIIFGIKKNYLDFDPYNVFWAITTNIPQRLKTRMSHIFVFEIWFVSSIYDKLKYTVMYFL